MRLLCVALVTISAQAAAVEWAPVGPASRSSIAGGPWVLAQGTAAFPAPNPATNFLQPYYQGYTTGSDSTLQGYFDYRPKGMAEAIVAARSTDGGRTWTFQSQVLSESGDDTGEGHPYVWSVGGQTLLYTLDRGAGVDSLGLFVRSLAPTGSDPLAGAPSSATPGSSGTPRTAGLLDPDGIIAAVPGTQTILYVSKDISVTPNVVSVRLADTTDGIHFTNDRAVSGLVTASLPFIGPRGTLLKYPDGHFGLIFSAGLVGEDADAFHFIGYAESNDVLTWTVINDVDHPLLSTDSTKDPTGGQPWYAGRLYAP
jgi:hypothetical protein